MVSTNLIGKNERIQWAKDKYNRKFWASYWYYYKKAKSTFIVNSAMFTNSYSNLQKLTLETPYSPLRPIGFSFAN
jgi:hypothetical protein